MKMDPTTESIAHFVGLFELLVEELRLRQDYLEFRLKQVQPEETLPPEVAGVHLAAPHELAPYKPGLSYEPQAPELPPEMPARMIASSDVEVPAPPEPPLARGPDIEVVLDAPPAFPVFGFVLQPAASLVSVTIQVISLSDDDLFLNGLGVNFVEPALLHAALDAIVSTADALVAFQVPELPEDGDWFGFAEDMLARIDAAEVPQGPAKVFVVQGAAAEGIFVDGVLVEEAPVWMDLLPSYLRPDEAEEEQPQEAGQAALEGETVDSHADGISGTTSVTSPAQHDFSRDFGGDTANPQGIDPGHEVVAGANQAINEIVVASQWIDAPVIVVRGNVVKLDAISQVNVLVEHDRIDGVAADQTSDAMNIAEITETSSEEDNASQPDDVLPGAWQVVRIEADLLQVNVVKQFTFVTDFDRAEVVFSANATFLGFGENQMVNSAVLNEIGYLYDLIFVAGDMVDMTVASQKNVLFDSDDVTTQAAARPQTLGGPAEPATGAVPPSDYLAPTLLADAAAQGAPEQDLGAGPDEAAPSVADAAPPARQVRSDKDASAHPAASDGSADPGTAAAKAGMSIESAAGGAGVAGPAMAATPGEAAPGEDTTGSTEVEVPDPAEPPAISVADNLLLNQATLETTGIDTFVEMTEAFAAMADRLAEGAETISREVAQDAMFAGKEALRVLQIDGDLAKVNLFEQTNVVGDADQVYLEMQSLHDRMEAEVEALRDRLEAQVKLIAGSNALVNLATVIEYGVDSKIMAGGAVYDDAFIHQAELFDTDSVPSGVALSALASEAVAAFLTAETGHSPDLAEAIVPTGSYEAASQPDVMQAALA